MSTIVLKDRRWVPVAVLCAIAMGAAGLLTAMRTDLSWPVGAIGGITVGLLAVLGLPSLPTKLPTIAVLGLGGLLVAHNAGLAAHDGWLLLIWGTALVFTLVATERLSHDSIPPLAGSIAKSHSAFEVARDATIITVVVGVLALILAPVVQDQLRPTTASGAPATQQGLDEAPSSLRANGSLDMTTRPRLSDEVVLRVAAPRPDFWRGETFDVWDGRLWTRSDTSVFPTLRGDAGATVIPEQLALPSGGEEWTQTVRVEAEYAEVLFGAPVISEIGADRRLLQRYDGTVVATYPFGRGAVYTVTSQQIPATETRLRSSDPRSAPVEILDRYAQPPVISPRVAQAGVAAVAGTTNVYDAIRSLEAWLGANTEYSIDAPLAPEGVDVVDHFLFESQIGWCQQVSSSLTVMLRHLGVPARVAVGFVPGEFDALSGEYVVRERDAHQWVEVYFPGVGWQGFDPTANVPLSGESDEETTPSTWLRDHWEQLVIVGVGVAVVLLGGFAARSSLRRRSVRRTRSWAAVRLDELEVVGRSIGRPRSVAETPGEYAAVLAELLDDGRSSDVAAAIDRAAWSRHGIEPTERRHTEQLLEDLRD